MRGMEALDFGHNLCGRGKLRRRMATERKGKERTAKGSSGKGSTGSSEGGKGEAYAKSSRCWPGYVPVPGKSEHEEGSCRKEPASKNGGQEVDRETARKKQIALGGGRAEQAKGKSPHAAERKTVSKAARAGRATAGKSAAKKTPAKRTTANKAPVKRTERKPRAKTTPATKAAAK